MALESYRDLIAWQKAMDVVELVYRHTATFPSEERFGLTNQLRRAAVSVPANIAEGQARLTKDFQQFLRIARGSLLEQETHVLIAQRLKYLTAARAAELLAAMAEVSRLITGLSKALDRRRK